MSQYITRIRTDAGDLQIDYNALANLPTVESMGAASTEHKHTISEITDFPTTLPANGGNADTLDDKHASDFAAASDVETLKTDMADVKAKMPAESLDLSSVTATAQELSYVQGVTSNIQTQLNGKSSTDHKHSANDVTSGALSIARGGTNAESADMALVNLMALGLNNISADKYQIVSGNDLNTFTTPGVYRSNNATISESLTNAPYYKSSGFRLIVSHTSGASVLIQVAVFNSANGRIFYRFLAGTSESTSWGAWREFMPSVLRKGIDYADSTDDMPAAGNEGRIFYVRQVTS